MHFEKEISNSDIDVIIPLLFDFDKVYNKERILFNRLWKKSNGAYRLENAILKEKFIYWFNKGLQLHITSLKEKLKI